MFSGLLPKDPFKRKGSLAKSYFKQNYCHACHASFAVVVPLPSCCVTSLIVSLRNRTGVERRQQTLSDKRDNNFV